MSKSRSTKSPRTIAPSDHLRRTAEEQLKKQSKTTSLQTEADCRRIQHELDVHQIELEMQNQALHATQVEVEAGLERYTELYDFAPVGYFTLAPDSRINLVNLTGAKLVGIERKRLIGQRFDRLVANNGRHRFSDFLALVFSAKTKQSCELVLAAIGQSPVTVGVEATLSANSQECRAVLVDITIRKRAEESQARLAMAVEQAAETIMITDSLGAILYANPAFKKTSGYACAEVLGKNPSILKSGKHDTAFYERMWSNLRSGQVWEGHFVNRRKDGTLFEEDASISPVRNAAGAIVNYVAVKRDVTRERQLEGQLHQSQKMESIGQLAGGVAHDFNNILGATLMHLNFLQQSAELTMGTKDALKEIEKEAVRAANLTRQLLLFSRRQLAKVEPVDMNELVNNLLKMLRRLLSENIEFSFHDSSTEAWVTADVGMLEQVVMNLCLNARDAMPRGGSLTLMATLVQFANGFAGPHPDARSGKFVCLSVTDTGCGMDKTVLERIFEPFFTTKDEGKGTGLGLATVYGIVKQHQGWVEVESEIGQGSLFRVYLPAGTKPLAEPISQTDEEIRGGSETILLVEDNLPVRRAAALCLRKLGYGVLEAGGGVEGPVLK